MKSVVLPIAIVLGWLLLIVSLSTSIGEWSHSQAIILSILGQLNPALAQKLSPDALETINFLLRKCAHFSEYAVLFGLAYWLCRSRIKLSKTLALPLVLGSVILFAVSDEFHQSFVPGRTSQAKDVLIDSLGAATVALVAFRLDRSTDETPPSSS